MYRALIRLQPRDLLLAIEAALTLAEARLRVRISALEDLRGWATKQGSRSRQRSEVLLAFRRASARQGGTCLARALALQCLLSRYGHASELRIGVGRTGKGFEAHAWLICNEETLEGAGQEADEFTVLASWQSGD